MLSGSMVAIITPMAPDGAIDYKRLAKLIDFHIDAGTEALIVAGTTGESATLTHAEHIELIERSCELANGRIPIVAGTGSNSTAQTLALSREMDSLPVTALLIVTPYYNKPAQNGLYQHFAAVADVVTHPVVLYNVPSRTGVDLMPATAARLAKHDNIIALKDATGELDRLEVHRDSCGPDFALLSGEDPTSAEFMLRGGHGVISVTGNVVPAAMRRLCDAARSGDRQLTESVDGTLRSLHRALFVESNPIPVKWAAEQMGLCGSGIRLPLTPLADQFHEQVRGAMKEAGVAPLASAGQS